MATVLQQSSTANQSQSGSLTRFIRMGVGAAVATVNATETSTQNTYRSPGTLSKLYVNILTNDRGTSTLTTRKNAGAGSQTVSITSSTTGEFIDSSNTDAVAAGDEFNYSMATGAAGTTFTWTNIQTLFSASSDTVVRFFLNNVNSAVNNASRFNPIAGLGQNASSETSYRFTLSVGGTFKNLFLNISANARTTTSVLWFRKNGARGNQTISVGATLTGFFEDTSNTDTAVAGNTVNYELAMGASAETLSTVGTGCDFVTTNNQWHIILSSDDTQAANLTRYSAISGGALGDATEANVAADANTNFSASNLAIYVRQNTVSATSTCKLRKNVGYGNQSVSITASTTGVYTDTSNSDRIVPTDSLCYEVVTGATGTQIIYANISMLCTTGIEFDAASNSTYNTADASYSWSHTCTGSNRYLVVGVSMLSVGGSSVTGVTYNSVAMTFLGAIASVSGAIRTELWGLVAPATGSNTIQVDLSAALDSIAGAVSFVGVHQTVPTEGLNTASATNVGAADATVAVTTVADEDWVIDNVSTDDTAITVGAGQTSRNNVTGTLGSGAMSTEGPVSPAGAVTMSWTNVAALATWSTGAIALRPVQAAGAAPPHQLTTLGVG